MLLLLKDGGSGTATVADVPFEVGYATGIQKTHLVVQHRAPARRAMWGWLRGGLILGG